MKSHHLKTILPWVAADSVISLGSAILLALVVAKLIGPVAFGIAGTTYLLGSLAETFVALPFSEALIQRRNLEARTIDAAFVGMLLSGLLAFLAMAGLAVPVARAFGAPDLVPLIVVQGSTCLLLGLRGVPEALLSRAFEFRALAIRNIVAKLSSAGVGVGLALAGAGAWSIIGANVIFALASTVMVVAIAGGLPRFRPDRAEAFGLLRFGVFSLADGLLWMVTPRLFCFLVGHYHGIRALGLLAVGFRINDAISALISAVTQRLALPIFSRTAEVPGQLDFAFQQGTRITAILAIPIFIGIAFVSTEIVTLFLGPDWAGADTALVAVSIYSVANFSRLLAPPAIKAVGRPSLLIWLNLVGLAYIGLGTMLAGPHGFPAQLAVWSSFSVVYFITSVLLLRRATGMGWRTQTEPLVGAAVASLGMSAALLATGALLGDTSGPVALAVKIAVGVVSYAALLGLLEWRFLTRMLALPSAAE